MARPLTERLVSYETIYQHIVTRYGGDNTYAFFTQHEDAVRQRLGLDLLKQMVDAMINSKHARLKSGADIFYAQAMAFAEAAAQVLEIPLITEEQEDEGYSDLDLLRIADDAFMGDFAILPPMIVALVIEAIVNVKRNGFQKENEA
jgi:hypothetical protein